MEVDICDVVGLQIDDFCGIDVVCRVFIFFLVDQCYLYVSLLYFFREMFFKLVFIF